MPDRSTDIEKIFDILDLQEKSVHNKSSKGENFYRSNLFIEAEEFFQALMSCNTNDQVVDIIDSFVDENEKSIVTDETQSIIAKSRAKDAAEVFRNICRYEDENISSFSVVEALYDLAIGEERSDLSEAFFAEIYHLICAIQGKTKESNLEDFRTNSHLSGREAANFRSNQLDELWKKVEHKMSRYKSGLEEDVIKRRDERFKHISANLRCSQNEWQDWHWQVRNVVKSPELLENLISLSPDVLQEIRHAKKLDLPFGVTPFYLSLMDGVADFDTALRYQVFPPKNYVDAISASENTEKQCDFMGEHDTSPISLITRRYPGIAIFKPYNTCPQICVYCQRNWEIDDAMSENAMASDEKIDNAIKWIEDHPAIHEILLTGGDPMVMSDAKILKILKKLSEIEHLERIRVGTRTLVTLPMRFTDELCDILASFRKPGKKTIEIVTHIEHVYEINPLMVEAVEKLKKRGIPVYNQLVYTFFVSRRFEAAKLRRMLKLIGIDPYYTFNTKGKEETIDYRVPIARLMQEQKEEARLLPGFERTDEAVYNVPKLGKHYLKAKQDRDLISILPDGSRIYKFHPWEKNIAHQRAYIKEDVPILDYLDRLKDSGENPEDYSSIWYYY